jgi:hypothetical protein
MANLTDQNNTRPQRGKMRKEADVKNNIEMLVKLD